MDENLKKNLLSTGTSIVGIVCNNGIVVAGDRKVTLGGQIVAHKNFPKVVQINDYLIISWTGGVSDAQLLKKLIFSQLKLKELKDHKRPSIKESANLAAMIAYRNIRQPSMIPFIAGSLIAGINKNGTTELYSIGASGSVIKVEDFDANISSGMPYILGFLERSYNNNITTEKGTELAIDSIKASSERDTASGCGIDVFTITEKGINHVSKQKVEKLYKEHD